MSGVVIVTGASRGIGAAVARMAASRGYDVVVNYRSRADAAEAVVADVRKARTCRPGRHGAGGRCTAAVRAVEREFGGVGALVNNAGIISAYGGVDALDAAALADNFSVKVVGYFLCAREAIRRMSTRHGGPGGAGHAGEVPVPQGDRSIPASP